MGDNSLKRKIDEVTDSIQTKKQKKNVASLPLLDEADDSIHGREDKDQHQNQAEKHDNALSDKIADDDKMDDLIYQGDDDVSFEIVEIEENDGQSTTNKVNADTGNQRNKRKKHNSYDWVVDTEFQSFEEARKFIEEQNFTKFKQTESDRVGLKFYYRCKMIPKDRKIWCQRQFMIHCPPDCSDVIVKHNNLSHNHNELLTENSTKRLSKQMIDFLDNLFELKTTQYDSIKKHIDDARAKENMFLHEPNPSDHQLAYRLKLFKQKDVKPIMNVGELMSWCKNHTDKPDDEHTPFILDYWSEKNNGTGPKFRFVFTTLFLLNMFKSVEKVCIDSTYKLNWNGFPLTILGTVDRNKKFHPIAFACTTNETQEDYAFVFRAVQSKIKEYFSVNFQPLILISDAADAIRNAFYKIFPDATTDIMCFAHVLRNVDKQQFKSKNIKKLVKEDIKLVQQAADKKTFALMAALFCDKWKSTQADFIEYFQKQWLGNHANWYEGAATYTPSTNNALEAVNGVIKSKITLRQRLPMNQFLSKMMDLIQDCSKGIYGGVKEFSKEPDIDSKTWAAAILMQQESFTSFKMKPSTSHSKHLSFAVPSSKCHDPTIPSYKNLSQRKWTSFDEYVEYGFQQFHLVHLYPSEAWNRKSACTCTSFMKQYVCKHVIALALREGHTECPDTEEPMLLSNYRRHRGKAKKAQPALVLG